MPRRRILHASVPRRPDRRRPGGNATDAQRPPRRGRRGQVEAIAERRTIALELRKAGGSYREIARQLGVDVHTVHGDVAAELAALRETTVGRAEELRALELERCDQMVAGLWPKVVSGNPPAVLAAVRVGERRSRLLGLDEPTATRTEISGSLSVDAQKRLDKERELFSLLSIQQMEEIAAESQALVDRVMVMVRANALTPEVVASHRAAVEDAESSHARNPACTGADVDRSGEAGPHLDRDPGKAPRTSRLVAVSPSPAAGVADIVTDEPAEESTAPTVTDQQGAGRGDARLVAHRGRDDE